MKYSYKVKNEYNLLEDYSGGFERIEDSLVWYYKKGSKMEVMFNRKLYLVIGKDKLVPEVVINRAKENIII